jgi:hypothetical protein
MSTSRALHRGDVFLPRRRLPEFAWEGRMDGEPMQRAGAVEGARSRVDSPTFVFASDFLEAEVPTAEWLCSKVGNPTFGAPCADSLLRTVVSKGTLVAHVMCLTPACPVLELHDGAVTSTTVPAPSASRVVSLAGRPVLLVWSNWVRSPDWTGGQLVVMLTSPPLRKAGEIPLHEVDARGAAQVVNRLGTPSVEPDRLRFTGTRSVFDRSSGKELSSVPIDETYALSPGGELVRK